ncbi:MAG: cation:proton antiporter [Pseudomonadota bacterium]
MTGQFDLFKFLYEIKYAALLLALFILPRVLMRFKIPTAVTSVAIGIIAGMGFEIFRNDSAIKLLATLGIVSIFLFAGLEVEFKELKRIKRQITIHLLFCVTALAGVAAIVCWITDIETCPGILVALALMTPSAGFILDSLATLKVNENERFWIKSKSIAGELLALAVLFITVHSHSIAWLSISIVLLATLIFMLPVMFRVFTKHVVPYSPKSMFAFLIVLAVVSASVTRQLGAYYLVGAFVVGLVARQFRHQVLDLNFEKTLHAVESFASVFIPFYFFRVGLNLKESNFSWMALLFASGFALVIPLRIAVIALHRRLLLLEPLVNGARIGTFLTPTLIFTLVIAEILRDQFNASEAFVGGLTIYALLTTIVPVIALHAPPPDFAEPHISHVSDYNT